MGWRQTWANLTAAPTPAPMQPPERWARPISFTLTVPTEMTEAPLAAGSARVSREQAMTVPAVKRGRDLICGTLGTLRLKQHDSTRKVVASELLEQPEEDVARSVTMTMTVEDMLFEGRAWWRVLAFGPDGYPSKVRRLESRSVTVRRDGRVYTSASGQAQGQALEWVPDEQLIRIDSPNDPVLVAGASAIRDALAVRAAASRYTANPLPLGYFTPDGDVDPGDEEEIEEILDDFEDSMSRRSWAYVGAGLAAKPLQWSPEQLQLASTKDAVILELSRVMGIDPEELGVSTTSRTYANAEQRRLDLIDFTLAAYVVAIEDRLSMGDVTLPGRYVRAEYGGFLRSDTQSRMQTYKTGREVGVFDDERIAELEDIPAARVRAATAAAKPTPAAAAAGPSAPAPATARREDRLVDAQVAGPVQFSADPGADVPAVTLGFVHPDGDPTFAADAERRVISGMVVPWGQVAYSGGALWMFKPGSLHWSSESRVKLDRDHQSGTEFGRATRLVSDEQGLHGTFKVAKTTYGDQALSLAQDQVYDGLSIQATFEAEADGWTAHPDDDRIRVVHSATLRKVALTAMPAYDDARVAAVAARWNETPPAPPSASITEPPAGPAAERGVPVTIPNPAAGLALAAAPLDNVPASAAPAPGEPATAAQQPDFAAFAAGLAPVLNETVRATVEAAFAALPQPQQRQVIPAGQAAVVTREAPVYLMNGHGPSLVRDSWKARTEHDHEAGARLRKFAEQTRDQSLAAMSPEFATTTGNASQIIPPGYRPDLYVTQLLKGRPLTGSVSRGTIADATPFNIPSFVSASGASAAHVEGTNPAAGSLTLGTVTVAPGAISGVFELSREIVDSANPAVDAIAMNAMHESYSQQTEAQVYAELNGTSGQGGTIDGNNFVPSGAQVTTTSGQGDELLVGIRAALARYPFNRFGAPSRAHLSQEATSALATAVGTDGRPLLPSVGAQNSVGVGNAVEQGWYVDGLTFQPTWSMSGNAAGDADVLIFNSNDIWAWESPLLMFRFEERGGPARIDLALFGYFATRILRPVGLAGIRHTAA